MSAVIPLVACYNAELTTVSSERTRASRCDKLGRRVASWSRNAEEDGVSRLKIAFENVCCCINSREVKNGGDWQHMELLAACH